MLTIWGRENSTNVKKVLWCVEEIGLPYEHIPAGGAYGVVDEPGYRAMNPNGLVPTVRDGELVLWESNAIVRYLTARYAEGTLWARDPAERAEGDRWMDWTTSTFAPVFGPVFRGLIRTPAANRDLIAIETGLRKIEELLAIVEHHLAVQPYLSGHEFGIGDFALGPMIYGWQGLPVERPQMPHVEAWYERLSQRPAYRKAVMIPIS